MKPKYFVQTVYEGRCPTCGEYQNGSFPNYVDKECSECRLERISNTLKKDKVIIYNINGDEISGFDIHLIANGKTYIIKATDFRDGIV